ncbi:DNA-binding protein P3A2-like isoform X2 [Limulus polyphemus]|nr:DNA-binding protein P3A2-like isoform X2 [Limulus polyphemus]
MSMTSDLGSAVSSTVNHNVIDGDEMSSEPSTPESNSYNDSDLLSSSTIGDDVTLQLAASGPVGVAAAAAIASGKKHNRSYSFEMNPSIRKRQQTRLIRKLKATVDEYTTRVGQQAVVLIVTPGKPHNNFKVFGAHPLENVVRNCRQVVMQELDVALAHHAPPQNPDDPTLHELPPLVIDGIPTPVEKMTQAQLRAFIPLMLKYSTGRGKPGWGKESTRPIWWPKDLPWANVRSDARADEDKQKVSWTHALRQIVINCYKYHCREDLLPAFYEEEEKEKGKVIGQNQRTVQTLAVSVVGTAGSVATALAGAAGTLYTQPLVAHYAPAVVQTISNPDGTVSILQIDPGSTMVTLPDGSHAQVRTVNAVNSLPLAIQNVVSDGTQNVQTLAEVAAASQPEETNQRNQQLASLNVDLHGEAVSTLNQDGQIILTGEDGTQSAFPVSGMVTIPMSVYQTVVTSMSQLSDCQTSHQGLQVSMANLETAECIDTKPVGIVSSSDRVDPIPLNIGKTEN